MDKLRIGIAGLGNMGSLHAAVLVAGEIEGARLAAVSDVNPELLEGARRKYGGTISCCSSAEQMMDSGDIDGIIIATPHYDHPTLAVKAFDRGLHVLIEKPAGVYTKNVRKMNAAAAASGKVFSIMYNQRLNPMYLKLRELVQSGELGEIRRTNWIVSNWYRTQSYYDSGSWRATWKGEGGGVLINQCPHQLDLWQWTTLLSPKRVRAFCQFGKHREIEVENEVTAYIEYENGATGVFITSTAEAPGTNRFEVAGTKGKIVIENGKLVFSRLRQSETEFNASCRMPFGMPECWEVDIPIPPGDGPQHKGILQNWSDAVVKGLPLAAPGEDGIHGLTLSNAMLLSTWTDDWVDYPLNEDLFYEELHKRINQSEEKQVTNR